MRKYAFIDVQNTASTTEKMLGFVVDWKKTVDFLKNTKSFHEILLYSGIDEGDQQTAAEFQALIALGCCNVKTKVTRIYKRRDKTVSINCVKCSTENTKVIDMGHDKKSNCDVELTADALEKAGPDTHLFIFSGDGDFEYLVKKVMEKGSKVTIVSHAKVQMRAGLPYGRYSTKLRDLVKANPEKLDFQEIDNWKFKIKKDVV